MKIRSASMDDFEALCAILGHEMAPDFAFGKTDWEKGAAEIRHVLAAGSVILAETDDGEIAGTVGLLQDDHFWWSSDQVITDKWIFVRPKFRKSRAIFLLMKYLQIVAKYSNVPVMLSISSPIDTETKGRLLERYGERIGSYYRILEA